MKTQRMLQNGQAMLILLVFMIVSIMIVSASTVMILQNSLSTTGLEQATKAKQLAESGAENALVRLLRDTAYTGEVLTTSEGTTTVVVSGTTTKTIVSQGKAGNFQKTVEVTAVYTNTVLSVTSWKEKL